jgi:hypothetical protein
MLAAPSMTERLNGPSAALKAISVPVSARLPVNAVVL